MPWDRGAGSLSSLSSNPGAPLALTCTYGAAFVLASSSRPEMEPYGSFTECSQSAVDTVYSEFKSASSVVVERRSTTARSAAIWFGGMAVGVALGGVLFGGGVSGAAANLGAASAAKVAAAAPRAAPEPVMTAAAVAAVEAAAPELAPQTPALYAPDIRIETQGDDGLVDCVRLARGSAPAASQRSACATPLWPMPREMRAGTVRRVVSPRLEFRFHGNSSGESAILRAAAARYGGEGGLLFPHGGKASPPNVSSKAIAVVRSFGRSASARPPVHWASLEETRKL